MARYLLGRLIRSAVTLWVIATLTFALMHAVPGGPFTKEKAIPEAVLRNLERKYHLDWPLWQQYLHYLWGIARWDFGPSFVYEGQTVNEIIARGFPVSAQLGAAALVLAVVAGILLGTAAGLRQHRWQDHLAMLFATLGFAIPSFVLATLLIYFFAYKWKLLPAGRWGTWEHAIMPVLALATLPTAFVARLVRSAMVEVLAQDFIRMARAKGLPQRVVIYRHALRNALLPVVTYLGPAAAGILTGSFVIEKIFAIPGLGRQFVLSVSNRDYTAIMGTTVFYSVILVAANLVVDLAYAWLDPRIKVGTPRE